jgi:3-oxoacyl-[acyl-carrier-protein] synthase III
MSADETRAFNAEFLDRLDDVVDECLARAGKRLADVDWILPSNVNELTWSRFARARRYPHERIFTELICTLGHTMTIDAFLNLEMAARGGRICAGDTCLLLGIGTGSYFAATLLEAAPYLRAER